MPVFGFTGGRKAARGSIWIHSKPRVKSGQYDRFACLTYDLFAKTFGAFWQADRRLVDDLYTRFVDQLLVRADFAWTVD